MARSPKRSLRAHVHDQLEPSVMGGGMSFVSVILVALVIVSLVALAIETEAMRPDTPLSPRVAEGLDVFNMVIVWVFAAEYVIRFWAVGEDPRYRGVGGRLRYAFSPLALADLLAFLPELLLMLYFPHVEGAALAALRALRLFRLFKLARYVPAFGIVGGAFRRAGAPLLAALAVMATQIYIAALLLYFIEGGIEGQEASFGSVTRALWWAVVTLTTVGYGDVFPVTVGGRIAAAFIALGGIGIVAMPTGILASAFAEEFRERHEAKLAARGKSPPA